MSGGSQRSPSSCTEDLRRRRIMAEGSPTGFPPTLGALSQSLVTSSAILHLQQSLIDLREHPVTGFLFPDSFQSSNNRPPSFLTHSPPNTYSTPLIQQTQPVVAPCVASLGQQDAFLWRLGLYLSSRALVSRPARPKRPSVDSNMANALILDHARA